MEHERYMSMALELARQAVAAGENPLAVPDRPIREFFA